MRLSVNGRSEDLEEGSSLETLLARMSLAPEAVVVELNGEIKNRERYAFTHLSEGDRVEVLRFVGGG